MVSQDELDFKIQWSAKEGHYTGVVYFEGVGYRTCSFSDEVDVYNTLRNKHGYIHKIHTVHVRDRFNQEHKKKIEQKDYKLGPMFKGTLILESGETEETEYFDDREQAYKKLCSMVQSKRSEARRGAARGQDSQKPRSDKPPVEAVAGDHEQDSQKPRNEKPPMNAVAGENRQDTIEKKVDKILSKLNEAHPIDTGFPPMEAATSDAIKEELGRSIATIAAKMDLLLQKDKNHVSENHGDENKKGTRPTNKNGLDYQEAVGATPGTTRFDSGCNHSGVRKVFIRCNKWGIDEIRFEFRTPLTPNETVVPVYYGSRELDSSQRIFEVADKDSIVRIDVWAGDSGVHGIRFHLESGGISELYGACNDGMVHKSYKGSRSGSRLVGLHGYYDSDSVEKLEFVFSEPKPKIRRLDGLLAIASMGWVSLDPLDVIMFAFLVWMFVVMFWLLVKLFRL